MVGILLENGDVDDDRMAVIRSVSLGMFLTFHRPVDVSMDTKWPTDSVIKLDSNNVITSQHPPVPVPVPILTSAQLGATPLLSTPKAEEDTGGLISKATSADFSDDFLDSPPKAEPQVAIETSYVHVDIDLPNSKKKSWLWRA